MTRKNIQDDLHKNNTLLSEKKILWWNLKEKWTRGAKQDSLNEYPYRQAFEKMNDAVHIN